ncbi:MAG: hypothetical protein ABGW91_13100 [Christiangramia sp.]|nr:hypothetical protein [Christiangramia sp.]|tara:strand:- start:94 stop:864 length:771 start_codon:yes stop_codon:yes gene_type:complete
MNNFRYFFLLLVLSSAIKVSAQDTQVFSGRVVDESNMAVQGINIINLDRGTGTSSQEDGSFELPAQLNDSIYFSAVQYANKTVVFEALMIGGNNEIVLQDRLDELDEVLISDIKLSGHISLDQKNRELSVYEKFGIPFPTPPPLMIDRQLQFMQGAGDPVSAIIYSLNGKRKLMQKAKEKATTKKLVMEAYGLLPLNYYPDELGIEEEEILNFLYYLADFSVFKNLVQSKLLFDLMDFMKEHSGGFLEIRNLPADE